MRQFPDWLELQNRFSRGCPHREDEPMAYYCYLLQCADGTYYCGWTKDVQRRLDTHNKGRGAKYTRIRRPVALVYYEELANQSEAMRREHKLKQKTREQKALLIQKFSEGSHERSI